MKIYPYSSFGLDAIKRSTNQELIWIKNNLEHVLKTIDSDLIRGLLSFKHLKFVSDIYALNIEIVAVTRLCIRSFSLILPFEVLTE